MRYAGGKIEGQGNAVTQARASTDRFTLGFASWMRWGTPVFGSGTVYRPSRIDLDGGPVRVPFLAAPVGGWRVDMSVRTGCQVQAYSGVVPVSGTVAAGEGVGSNGNDEYRLIFRRVDGTIKKQWVLNHNAAGYVGKPGVQTTFWADYIDAGETVELTASLSDDRTDTCPTDPSYSGYKSIKTPRGEWESGVVIRVNFPVALPF